MKCSRVSYIICSRVRYRYYPGYCQPRTKKTLATRMGYCLPRPDFEPATFELYWIDALPTELHGQTDLGREIMNYMLNVINILVYINSASNNTSSASVNTEEVYTESSLKPEQSHTHDWPYCACVTSQPVP